jgi:hypothetical protein
MIQIQVTLFDTTGKVRPVSTIVNVESIRYYQEHKKEIMNKGIIKICQQRLWTKRDLEKNHYLNAKMRLYNKEKIEKEKQEKYEKIKEERGWK